MEAPPRSASLRCPGGEGKRPPKAVPANQEGPLEMPSPSEVRCVDPRSGASIHRSEEARDSTSARIALAILGGHNQGRASERDHTPSRLPQVLPVSLSPFYEGLPVRRLMGPADGDFRRLMGPPLSQHHGATGKGGLSQFRRLMGPPQTRFSQGHGATRRGRPEVIEIHPDDRAGRPSGGINGLQGDTHERCEGSPAPLVGGA